MTPPGVPRRTVEFRFDRPGVRAVVALPASGAVDEVAVALHAGG